MEISKKYSILSIYLAAFGLLFYFLILRELPNNDSAEGTYIIILLNFAIPPEYGQEIIMHEQSFWSITEARIISILYVTFISVLILSIVSGVVAYIKNEPTKLHSGPIAISTVLLSSAYQLSWVFNWWL